MLAAGLWMAACCGLGTAFLGRVGGRDEADGNRWVGAALAGVLLLYVWLLMLQAVGLRYSRWTLLPVLGLGLAALLWEWMRWPPHSGPLRLDRWGEALAVLTVGIYGLATIALWNVNPDFIYHWGIKGEKSFLAGAIDFEFLARPWNVHIHPEYPNLLPALFAATAVLAGSFREVDMMFWSVGVHALTLAAAWNLLERLAVAARLRQLALAVLALVLTMFGVGYLVPGGADGMVAVGLMVAAAALAAPPGRPADWQMGVAAAFVAAAKIEGIPLAGFLLAIYLLRRLPAETTRGRFAAAFPAILPTAVMLLAWGVPGISYGLLAQSPMDLRLERIGTLLPALWRSLLTVNWHGWALVVLAIPWLLLRRSLRPIAMVLMLQMSFYVFAYLSRDVDTRLWVETSAARLLFHLVPLTLILCFAACSRPAPPDPELT